MLTLSFLVGIQGRPQFRQMLGRVPEVEDALGQREVLAKEFFQTTAAIRQRDLLVGIIPTHLRGLTAELRAQLVELVKAG